MSERVARRNRRNGLKVDKLKAGVPGYGRRISRHRIVDRTYTSPHDYKAKQVVNDYKEQLEPLTGTNHERMLFRRELRNATTAKH
jgi:hypothetical protein